VRPSKATWSHRRGTQLNIALLGRTRPHPTAILPTLSPVAHPSAGVAQRVPPLKVSTFVNFCKPLSERLARERNLEGVAETVSGKCVLKRVREGKHQQQMAKKSRFCDCLCTFPSLPVGRVPGRPYMMYLREGRASFPPARPPTLLWLRIVRGGIIFT
jgi:hypothetical protein